MPTAWETVIISFDGTKRAGNRITLWTGQAMVTTVRPMSGVTCFEWASCARNYMR
jgi:hypothetical protein